MPRRVAEYSQELVDWIRGLYGPDRDFSSARALAKAAGYNPNQVNNIEVYGYGSAETLIDVAKTAGVPWWSGLVASGLLTEEDVKGVPVPEMTPFEVEILGKWRGLNEVQRSAMTALFESWQYAESRLDGN